MRLIMRKYGSIYQRYHMADNCQENLAMTVVVCLDHLVSVVFTIYGFLSLSTPVHRSMSSPIEPFSAQARSKQALHVFSIIILADNKANVMQCLFEQLTGSTHSGKVFPTW